MAAAEGIGMLVGTGMGMMQQEQANRQNKSNQRNTYELQRKLNKQGKELALEMWHDTNYSAQVNELKKAGLSTGLMYEGGGAGGTTSAGSGGSAPSAMPVQNNMGMGIETAQAMANIKLAEANANKAEAEAENLRGANRENTKAQTNLIKTQTEGNELANKLANKTLDDQAEIIKHELLKVAGQGQQEQAKGKFADSRENIAVQQDKANVAYAIVKTRLDEKNIKLTESQIAKIANDIATNNFNAETARNTIGVDKVAGSLLQNIVNEIYNMIGYDKDRADQKVNDNK